MCICISQAAGGRSGWSPTVNAMDDDQRLADSIAFNCIILGLDGVTEEPPEPSTPLGQLMALEQQCIAEGTEADFPARAAELWARLRVYDDPDEV